LAVDAGSTSARVSLAYMYLTDEEDGVPENLTEGYRLMLQAADAGDANAQSSVASCYAQSGDCPLGRSVERAEHYYQLAIAQGNTVAVMHLAEHQVSGEGVRRNTSEGLATLRRLASGDTTDEWIAESANWRLGLIYEYGVEGAVSPNRSLAVQYYSAAARLGHTTSQNALRRMGVTTW
jgi:TPR repeat protein